MMYITFSVSKSSNRKYTQTTSIFKGLVKCFRLLRKRASSLALPLIVDSTAEKRARKRNRMVRCKCRQNKH